MKTLEQRRAAHALERVAVLEQVAALEKKPAEFKKLYRAYVDRLGPAILMNGLGQALATERAAAGPNPQNERSKAHGKLYASLEDWLCREGDDSVYPGADDLLRAITQYDQSHYLHAQAEALAWLEWHKKCCRAAFPSSEGDRG